MTTVYKYRVYCNTDSQNETVWAETEPTTCPSDPVGHTIDQTKTVIIETRDPDIVTVKEESTATGGHFVSEQRLISINASETKTVDYTWPIPINVLSLLFITTSDNEGDEVELSVAPDTVIGNITSDVSASDTVINVSSTVTDNIKLGYFVSLFDGTNTDDCGRCTVVDAGAGTITVETAATQGFAAATPTYVRMTVKMIHTYTIGPAGRYSVGDDKIGGSYVPAGTTIRTIYTNNEASAKTIAPQIDYLY